MIATTKQMLTKKNILFLMSMLSYLVFSQLVINAVSFNATLDISTKTYDGIKPEKLLPPRLTGNQIKSADNQYSTVQNGTLPKESNTPYNFTVRVSDDNFASNSLTLSQVNYTATATKTKTPIKYIGWI